MIKRQRRRLISYALFICAPLATLTLFAQMIGANLTPATQTAIWLGVFALAFGPLLLALRFAPALRSVVDQMLIGAVTAVPLFVLMTQLTPPNPLSQAIATWIILYMIIRFKLVNRILPHRAYTASATYRTGQSAYTIWAEEFPDPGLLDRHWTPALRRLELDRKNPNQRRAMYDFGFGIMRQKHTLRDVQMHTAFVYDFQTDSPSDILGADGSFGVMITNHGTTRGVTLTLTLLDLPFTDWLAHWLDDLVGDQADYRVARLEGHHGFSMTADLLRNAPTHQSGGISPAALPA